LTVPVADPSVFVTRIDACCVGQTRLRADAACGVKMSLYGLAPPTPIVAFVSVTTWLPCSP
jgi:hypothetical protein